MRIIKHLATINERPEFAVTKTMHKYGNILFFFFFKTEYFLYCFESQTNI